MAGAQPKTSCRSAFKQSDILPPPLENPRSRLQDDTKTDLKEIRWEGSFEHGNKPSFSVKYRGISCLADELSAREDGVRFVELGCRPECNIFGRSRPNNLTGVVYKILQRRERLLWNITMRNIKMSGQQNKQKNQRDVRWQKAPKKTLW